MLKTIKSELEDEEESVNQNFEQQDHSARISHWGMKIPEYHHLIDSASSGTNSERRQFQEMKNIQR
jgi:hypothetical protein